MANQNNNASCYSCEGTLLIPTVDDRVSHWRERLVSGKRLTITLKVVGQRWSSDAVFLLWGENYQQEKVFEVNLRYVRAYFMRTRTWHEITSSDRRRFALSFHDSNQFARFFEELESTLSFLKKLTKIEKPDESDGGIVILRTDKLPPPKPPRAGDNPPSPVVVRTPPPLDEQLVPHCDRYLDPIECVARGVSCTETREVEPENEQTTRWYVNIFDGVTTTPAGSNTSDSIYDTIDDAALCDPPNPSDSRGHDDADTYDNISDELIGRSGPCKPNANKAFIGSSDGGNRTVPSGLPTSRKPVAAHVYDDIDRRDKRNSHDDSRDGYDNTDSCSNGSKSSYDNVVLDLKRCQPIIAKSKPRLDPRSIELTGPTLTVLGVTDNTNRRPNIPPETGSSKPQPLPRPRKPKDDRYTGDDWNCSQCTLINPSSANRCSVCDMERHGSRVKPVTASRDTPADALRRLPSAYVVTSECFHRLIGQWTCSVCTMANGSESDVCQSCSSWVCGHCTVHNHPDLWICSVCSHSRLLT